MDIGIEDSWKRVLDSEFEKPYFKSLMTFLEGEYKTNICYPPKCDIFNAFQFTPFEKVKVVIIGQDPYHGPEQANGLAFSVNEGIKHPPSLKNIFQELESDLKIKIPESGNLTKWAEQGVLLLNAILSVREDEAGSHKKQGWEIFTDNIITSLSDQREGLVFLLWGGYAQKKGAKIDRRKHVVLETGHPSPLSANRGFWFGNEHFSKTNKLLSERKLKPINW